MKEFIDYTKDIFKGINKIVKSDKKFYERVFIDEIYSYGALSFPMIILVSFFFGLTMTMQMVPELIEYGSELVSGGLVMVPLARELGPLIIAIIISGRVGSAMTAELGSMNISNQIDSLSLMSINPVEFLVSPRVLASILMLPVLTLTCIVLGAIGSYIMAVYGFDLAWGEYINNTALMLKPYDIFGGLIKALFFGFVIAYIACYKGIFLKGRSQDIGRATTDSVAFSITVILLMNSLLSYILFS